MAAFGSGEQTMVIRAVRIVSITGVISMVVVSAGACGGSEGSTVGSGPRAGSEGGLCAGDKSCDVGLVCLSDLCVKPANDDGGSTTTSTSSSSGGSSSGSADGSIGDGSSPFDAAACKGSHPLLDASLRYCEAEHCYCKKNDSCLAKVIAAQCCDGDQGTCY